MEFCRVLFRCLVLLDLDVSQNGDRCPALLGEFAVAVPPEIDEESGIFQLSSDGSRPSGPSIAPRFDPPRLHQPTWGLPGSLGPRTNQRTLGGCHLLDATGPSGPDRGVNPADP